MGWLQMVMKTVDVARWLKMDLLAVGSLQPWPPPVWCKVWVSGAVGRLAAPLVRAVEGLLSPTPPDATLGLTRARLSWRPNLCRDARDAGHTREGPDETQSTKHEINKRNPQIRNRNAAF